MPEQPPAKHWTIVAVDVQSFTAWRRTDRHRLVMREGLYRVLAKAFTESGVAWRRGRLWRRAGLYHEDRGDGAFALIPASVEKGPLAASLPENLTTALSEHNRNASAPETRMRLRVALNAGEVHLDPNGAAGMALNLTFRLLDADPLRRELDRSADHDLALIASNWFYDSVIRHTPECDPGGYRPVSVAPKGNPAEERAWVTTPEPVLGAGDGLPERAWRERLRELLDEFSGTREANTDDAGHWWELRLTDLTWAAGGRRLRLDPDPLTVRRRAVAVVFDASGPASGLANVVTGLARPLAGTVAFDQVDVTGREPGARRIALIPVGGELLPHRTVEDNIAYGSGAATASPRAADIAHRLHLSDVLRLYPHELSPVQRLRVAVARALCAHPEPVAVVIEDRDGHPACRAAVATARDQDLAVLVVTDSEDRARELSDRPYAVRAVRQEGRVGR